KDTTGGNMAVPGTLANIAAELMRRYPEVTINIAGVEGVIIDNVTLRCPRVGRDHVDGAVNAILNTLAAGDRGKFEVNRYGENQFVLFPPPRPESARRNIEVFNLQFYL